MTAFRKLLLALRATSRSAHRESNTAHGVFDEIRPRDQDKSELERRMAERARHYLNVYPAGSGR